MEKYDAFDFSLRYNSYTDDKYISYAEIEKNLAKIIPFKAKIDDIISKIKEYRNRYVKSFGLLSSEEYLLTITLSPKILNKFLLGERKLLFLEKQLEKIHNYDYASGNNLLSNSIDSILSEQTLGFSQEYDINFTKEKRLEALYDNQSHSYLGRYKNFYKNLNSFFDKEVDKTFIQKVYEILSDENYIREKKLNIFKPRANLQDLLNYFYNFVNKNREFPTYLTAVIAYSYFLLLEPLDKFNFEVANALFLRVINGGDYVHSSKIMFFNVYGTSFYDNCQKAIDDSLNNRDITFLVLFVNDMLVEVFKNVIEQVQNINIPEIEKSTVIEKIVYVDKPVEVINQSPKIETKIEKVLVPQYIDAFKEIEIEKVVEVPVYEQSIQEKEVIKVQWLQQIVDNYQEIPVLTPLDATSVISFLNELKNEEMLDIVKQSTHSSFIASLEKEKEYTLLELVKMIKEKHDYASDSILYYFDVEPVLVEKIEYVEKEYTLYELIQNIKAREDYDEETVLMLLGVEPIIQEKIEFKEYSYSELIEQIKTNPEFNKENIYQLLGIEPNEKIITPTYSFDELLELIKIHDEYLPELVLSKLEIAPVIQDKLVYYDYTFDELIEKLQSHDEYLPELVTAKLNIQPEIEHKVEYVFKEYSFNELLVRLKENENYDLDSVLEYLEYTPSEPSYYELLDLIKNSSEFSNESILNYLNISPIEKIELVEKEYILDELLSKVKESSDYSVDYVLNYLEVQPNKVVEYSEYSYNELIEKIRNSEEFNAEELLKLLEVPPQEVYIEKDYSLEELLIKIQENPDYNPEIVLDALQIEPKIVEKIEYVEKESNFYDLVKKVLEHPEYNPEIVLTILGIKPLIVEKEVEVIKEIKESLNLEDLETEKIFDYVSTLEFNEKRKVLDCFTIEELKDLVKRLPYEVITTIQVPVTPIVQEVIKIPEKEPNKLTIKDSISIIQSRKFTNEELHRLNYLSDSEAADTLIHINPAIKQKQADFYSRHRTKYSFYTLSQYKDFTEVVYETARTSMDFLVSVGLYTKVQQANKFCYSPVIIEKEDLK